MRKIIELLIIVVIIGIWLEPVHSQVPLKEAQANNTFTIQHDTSPLPDTTVVPSTMDNSDCVEARGSEGKAWICGHNHRAYFSEPQRACRVAGREIRCDRE